MAAAKAAPSSAVVATDAHDLSGGTAPDVRADGERRHGDVDEERRDTPAGDQRDEERDEGWPGPIDEPPPLFSA